MIEQLALMNVLPSEVYLFQLEKIYDLYIS